MNELNAIRLALQQQEQTDSARLSVAFKDMSAVLKELKRLTQEKTRAEETRQATLDALQQENGKIIGENDRLHRKTRRLAKQVRALQLAGQELTLEFSRQKERGHDLTEQLIKLKVDKLRAEKTRKRSETLLTTESERLDDSTNIAQKELQSLQAYRKQLDVHIQGLVEQRQELLGWQSACPGFMTPVCSFSEAESLDR